jgi:hypothetical protein
MAFELIYAMGMAGILLMGRMVMCQDFGAHRLRQWMRMERSW